MTINDEGGGSAAGGGPATAEGGTVALAGGWRAELVRAGGGARLHVAQGSGPASLELTIFLTAEGPVVRAHAAALEIDSDADLVARCTNFRVEARGAVELVAGETLRAQGRRVEVEATHGSARVRANDHVQLRGENILLNCDPPGPALPAWAGAKPVPTPPAPLLQSAAVSGDSDIAALLCKKS